MYIILLIVNLIVFFLLDLLFLYKYKEQEAKAAVT